MKLAARTRKAIRMLVNRRQFDVDLEEEMSLHLELRQQDQIESGMSADDAQVQHAQIWQRNFH